MSINTWIPPWIITNLLAIALLSGVFRRPRVVQALLSLLFVAAAGFNASLALSTPEVFISGFGPYAAWFYQPFIYGFFAEHTALLVCAIAVGQAAVGLLLLTGGASARLGMLGGILFLLAIAPLGIGSAFPATLALAASMYHLYRQPLGHSLPVELMHQRSPG
ncbi:MAG: hypothetical protein CVV27_15285 [Candidatus Melainabacteria bacterium HGW-Melainabacteria-1]|nr:MAG: hypothetical protein CVV27_15285 [Candidatus Melainabacteria bacterium HGW-Melainabacteria-1]